MCLGGEATCKQVANAITENGGDICKVNESEKEFVISFMASLFCVKELDVKLKAADARYIIYLTEFLKEA